MWLGIFRLNPINKPTDRPNGETPRTILSITRKHKRAEPHEQAFWQAFLSQHILKLSQQVHIGVSRPSGKSTRQQKQEALGTGWVLVTGCEVHCFVGNSTSAHFLQSPCSPPIRYILGQLSERLCSGDPRWLLTRIQFLLIAAPPQTNRSVLHHSLMSTQWACAQVSSAEFLHWGRALPLLCFAYPFDSSTKSSPTLPASPVWPPSNGPYYAPSASPGFRLYEYIENI